MICRKLYHWMIGVAFAVLDVGEAVRGERPRKRTQPVKPCPLRDCVLDAGHDGIHRDEGLPRMSPEQVREAVRTVSDRARTNDRGIAEELLKSHAPPDPRQAILADPRMDGTTWLSAASVDKAMVDAWPFWEWWAPGAAVVVLSSAFVAHGPMASPQHKLRPLRVAGMDDSGDGMIVVDSVAGTDRGLALPIYDRLHPNDWQFRCEGSTWRPFATSWPGIDEVVTSVRPAIWAELDES